VVLSLSVRLSVRPSVKSDHKTVIANPGPSSRDLNMRRDRRAFRKCMPTQNALFLESASQLNIETRNLIKAGADMQTNFDQLYSIMTSLLDQYYPKREIIVTSNDLRFATPAAKARCGGRTG